MHTKTMIVIAAASIGLARGGAHGVTRVENPAVVSPDSTAIVAADKRAGNSLETAVRANLDANARLAGRGIGVQTRGNIVTLTGEVESVAEKELAGRIAADTPEVAEVRNRLLVRGR